MHPGTRIRSGATALVLIGVTAGLVGCSAEAEPEYSGDGVAPGATMEEYREAFADIDPIVLNTQMAGPEGSLTNEAREAYYASIEEWSDGKLTFEIAYSSSIVQFIDTDEAILDGRLDIGFASPGYKPDDYPVNSLLENASVAGSGSPIGYMQTTGALTQLAVENDEFGQELIDEGLYPLLFNESGNIAVIFCSQDRHTLADLEDATIAVSGKAKVAEAEALGMVPVSMSYQEQYEALQRGVIDCALSGPQAANTAGITEVAPYMVADSEATFSFTASQLIINKEVWDGLPLVARQLLFDKLPVYVAGTMAQNYAQIVVAVQAVLDAGGSVTELDDAAREALSEGNDGLLETLAGTDVLDDGDAVAEQARSLAEEWLDKLHEAGYDGWNNSYEDFLEAYSETEPTAEEFEAYAELVLAPQQSNRPSAD